MVTAQELAARLSGREYTKETTKADEREAEESGLVIVVGAGDDLMEFRGAIYDETGMYGGGTVYLTSAGLLTSACNEGDECPYFKKLLPLAATIEAKWDTDGYTWVYETAIPHATFEVVEDGEKYCRGIVFALAVCPPP